MLLLIAPTLGADEGKPAWWWNCKSGDLVVRGDLTYGDEPDITFSMSNGKKKIPGYYLGAKLSIANVLYLNRHSKHSDDFRFYLRHIDKEHDAFVMANRIFVSEMPPEEVRVVPYNSIPKGSKIMIFDIVRLLPFNGLVLKAIVPKNEEPEARKILRERFSLDLKSDLHSISRVVKKDELTNYLRSKGFLKKVGVDKVAIVSVDYERVGIADFVTGELIGEVYHTIQDGWHLKARHEVMEYRPGKGWAILEMNATP